MNIWTARYARRYKFGAVANYLRRSQAASLAMLCNSTSTLKLIEAWRGSGQEVYRLRGCKTPNRPADGPGNLDFKNFILKIIIAFAFSCPENSDYPGEALRRCRILCHAAEIACMQVWRAAGVALRRFFRLPAVESILWNLSANWQT